MQGTCLLAWRVIFDMRKIGVLSVFSLFFDGGVGGKASGRDASG